LLLRQRVRAGIGQSVNRFRPELGPSHLGSEYFLVHGNLHFGPRLTAAACATAICPAFRQETCIAPRSGLLLPLLGITSAVAPLGCAAIFYWTCFPALWAATNRIRQRL